MVGRVRKPERFPAVDGIREKRENWYARAYREEAGRWSRILEECIETAEKQEEPQGRAVLRLSSTD